MTGKRSPPVSDIQAQFQREHIVMVVAYLEKVISCVGSNLTAHHDIKDVLTKNAVPMYNGQVEASATRMHETEKKKLTKFQKKKS